MTSFVNVKYSSVHGATLRAESAVAAVRALPRAWIGGRGIAALLIAAMAAAAVAVAYQVMDSVGEGHLLVLWIALWAAAFGALALFAHTALKVTAHVKRRLDAWSAKLAQASADARLLEAARNDPRIMAELQSAVAREEAALALLAPAAATVEEPVLRLSAAERIYLRGYYL